MYYMCVCMYVCMCIYIYIYIYMCGSVNTRCVGSVCAAAPATTVEATWLYHSLL